MILYHKIYGARCCVMWCSRQQGRQLVGKVNDDCARLRPPPRASELHTLAAPKVLCSIDLSPVLEAIITGSLASLTEVTVTERSFSYKGKRSASAACNTDTLALFASHCPGHRHHPHCNRVQSNTWSHCNDTFFVIASLKSLVLGFQPLKAF